MGPPGASRVTSGAHDTPATAVQFL